MKPRPNQSPSPVGTDLELEKQSRKSLPEINLSDPGKSVGPQPSPGGILISQNKKNTKVPITGMILGPGLYRSTAHISVLKEFERNKHKIHFIGGHGFSGLIASYYAFHLKPDLVEWKMHKLLSKIGNHRPYGKEWRKEVLEVLKKDFKGKRIEQAKLNLFVPVREGKRVVYKKRGDLYQSLVSSFEDVNSVTFKQQVFDSAELKKLGVDITIGVNVLGPKMTWKYPVDFLVGLYGRAAGKSPYEGEVLDLYLNFDLKDLEVDDSKEVTEILKMASSQSPNFNEQVKEFFSQWKRD